MYQMKKNEKNKKYGEKERNKEERRKKKKKEKEFHVIQPPQLLQACSRWSPCVSNGKVIPVIISKVERKEEGEKRREERGGREGCIPR